MQETTTKSSEYAARVLFLVLFGLIDHLVRLVILAIAAFQYLFTLITSKRNPYLNELGSSLSNYGFQIMQYLTYTSDNKPFPFSEWPKP